MNQLLKNAVRFLLGACTLTVAAATWAAQPSVEPGALKLGVEPWLGYGPMHVAAAQGFFAKRGLEKVELVNFNEDKDINAGLASGQLDAATIATHTAMGMVSAGLPVKIVMLLDQSMTADAVIAAPDIKRVQDLKGKEIAFEEGTTSDILLHAALAKAGLQWVDIKPVPMPASNAGSALIAGRVPVAVTYEPYLTAAHQQNAKLNVLFSGKDQPGIISDVLVIREDVISKRPGQVQALVNAWGDAVTHYRANTASDRAVIAKAVGASPEDLASAFDGVEYYDFAQNTSELEGVFKEKTFPMVLKAAIEAQLVSPQKPVDANTLIDGQFVRQKN
ncbi:ABC transporter substrate-binding protein [Pseudomonas typographi]|uniref:ABC transporter substrate-binding protein n=1 Tax=Pseudomonas typographi TaxID=2715964 RepID=A0ABR7Z385_9PSED|nr:ABC transporter substrate-binding protein [Pseudomonas typographi]MBD1599882.1 ABC transporter substrate-binding protein [Pseudomonas typographi]